MARLVKSVYIVFYFQILERHAESDAEIAIA